MQKQFMKKYQLNFLKTKQQTSKLCCEKKYSHESRINVCEVVETPIKN